METKPWYASVTIWGALLAALVPVGGFILHRSVSDTDIQSLAVALAAIGGGAGSLIAIIGRFRATTMIGSAAGRSLRALLPLGLIAGMGWNLSACTALNAYSAAALSAGEQSAQGAVANVKKANVDAVELWKTAACGLTVGGLSGSGDPIAIKSALMACPIPSVGTVTLGDNGSISVQTSGTVAASTSAGTAKP